MKGKKDLVSIDIASSKCYNSGQEGNGMKIYYSDNSPTVVYAAEELKKYLDMMNGGSATVISGCIPEDAPQMGLVLMLADPRPEDTPETDRVVISVSNGCGVISGNNRRSILQAVYEYLKSAGCIWVRPGKDGEHIPRVDISAHSFTLDRTADHPFRGQVIEGAISREDVLDTVEWMPKVGYNAFMIQFISPYNYFLRRSEHRLNPTKAPQPESREVMDGYTKDIEMAVKRTGMQLHALGHGYLLAPFGIISAGEKATAPLPEEVRPYVALLNGKRDYYQNSANYTHLCYSNPYARDKVTDFLVKYMQDKPHIDYLHLYLADSFRNTCECEECAKHTVSDFYCMMLNELDAKLTALGIDSKIVMTIYVDTFWAPKSVRINNPDRFIMLLSMQRDHNKVMSDQVMPDSLLPKWKRNVYNLKPTSDMILGFREQWKPILDVPSFSFDYDLYSTHFYDPGYFQMARLMHDDIAIYPKIGLLGRMSCQSQRCAFPNALPGAVLGETLTDSSLDFDEYADRYFLGAYGKDGLLAKEYLQRVTELFSPQRLRIGESVVVVDTASDEAGGISGYVGDPVCAKRLASIPDLIHGFMPVIERNLNTGSPTHNKSWQILAHHGEFCRLYSRVFLALCQRDSKAALDHARRMEEWLCSVEDELSPYLDHYLFLRRLYIIVGDTSHHAEY